MSWIVLSGVTVILLFFYFKSKGIVWACFLGGLLVGFLWAYVMLFRDYTFAWITIGKAAIVGTLIGFTLEMLFELGKYLLGRKFES